MGHGVVILLYNPWVMGRAFSIPIVQPMAHGKLILHDPWVVQQDHSPWAMGCTTRCTALYGPMGHGGFVMLYGPWVMGKKSLNPVTLPRLPCFQCVPAR